MTTLKIQYVILLAGFCMNIQVFGQPILYAEYENEMIRYALHDTMVKNLLNRPELQNIKLEIKSGNAKFVYVDNDDVRVYIYYSDSFELADLTLVELDSSRHDQTEFKWQFRNGNIILYSQYYTKTHLTEKSFYYANGEMQSEGILWFGNQVGDWKYYSTLGKLDSIVNMDIKLDHITWKEAIQIAKTQCSMRNVIDVDREPSKNGKHSWRFKLRTGEISNGSFHGYFSICEGGIICRWEPFIFTPD